MPPLQYMWQRRTPRQGGTPLPTAQARATRAGKVSKCSANTKLSGSIVLASQVSECTESVFLGLGQSCLLAERVEGG